jgi:Mg2+/Co2+ transporter CorB
MDENTLISLAAIFILIVLSAFFSGSETALTATSRARIHHLERKGDRRAGIVRRLRDDKENLIGAILLGNNLVNILATSLATSLLIGYFGEAGIVYATLGMTLLVLILAEVLPKTYAINHADRAALRVAPLLRWVVGLLGPAAHAIQLIVRTALRLFGGRTTAGDSMTAREEELRGAIDLHRGESREIRHERAMLRSILDLADVEVREIMIHRRNVVTIDTNQPPDVILERVLASPFTRMPLWLEESQNIIGVLHAKALLRAFGAHGGDLQDMDILAVAATPWFIPETTTLFDQLQAFRRRREHFALVVDEYGSLMGIVTLEDILEEIVGEIADEHDVPVAGVRSQPDGSYIIAGTVTIRDLNRDLEWSLPDKDAATVAGLILHEARTIPDVGQIYEFHGCRFEILHRLRNQITSVRVTPVEKHEVRQAG